MQRNVKTTSILIVIGLVIWWCAIFLGGARSGAKSVRAVDENRYLSLTLFKLPFGPSVTLMRVFDAQRGTLGLRLNRRQVFSHTLGRSNRGEFALWESGDKSTWLRLVDPLTLKTRVSRELPFSTRGDSCAFSADGKWLLVNQSASETFRWLLLSSNTLETVDSIEFPQADYGYELGTSFFYHDSQLLVFNEGKLKVVPFAFGSPGASNECLSVSGSAMLLRTTDWVDASGQAVVPVQADDDESEENLDAQASDESLDDAAAVAADDSLSTTQRIRHFIHWPLENRSLEVPNELLGRDTFLLCDGTRLVTYDRGLDEQTSRLTGSESLAIVMDASGQEITRFHNMNVPSIKPVHVLWESLREKSRIVIGSRADVVKAQDGARLPSIDNRPFRLAYYALVASAIIWCIVWIWPSLGNRQTLMSVGGLLVMASAGYPSAFYAFIDAITDYFGTVYSASLLVPATFAVWWLFASDWPLPRRLAGLLTISAIAWEPIERIESYNVLSTLVVLGGGTILLLIRRVWPSGKRVTDAPDKMAANTFSMADLFLWMTCIGIWMYCDARPQLTRDVEWQRLLKLVVGNGLSIGGSLLLVWGGWRHKVVGVVMLLLACSLDLLRPRFPDMAFMIIEGPMVYLQAALIAVLVVARLMLAFLTKLKLTIAGKPA